MYAQEARQHAYQRNEQIKERRIAELIGEGGKLVRIMDYIGGAAKEGRYSVTLAVHNSVKEDFTWLLNELGYKYYCKTSTNRTNDWIVEW